MSAAEQTSQGPAPTSSTLSDRDREILAMERSWWQYAGAKEQAIREQFDMSSTRYYQVLNALIDREDALAGLDLQNEFTLRPVWQAPAEGAPALKAWAFYVPDVAAAPAPAGGISLAPLAQSRYLTWNGALEAFAEGQAAFALGGTYENFLIQHAAGWDTETFRQRAGFVPIPAAGRVPVTLAEGQATLHGDLNIYYCEAVNVNLCFIERVRINAPVVVGEGDSTTVRLEHTIVPPVIESPGGI